ncbi:MAG: signal peptide peptidase SppA [Candidatus Cloacimonetes bacterium]|nr:signal peptide peptidase SppA [Candidatus Cloacimonadota bacterium]MCF7814899.1 signal peptide peptidase SppA [Candidatus Cloacimonadota bacterium]MCF7869306.1 signal peptide peptidase SppA [Candidatus Cloacimonadota bacterium]MCF7884614.1 signal peptide peptidase SppA [Candidatus Cloacimonadota bacterium]
MKKLSFIITILAIVLGLQAQSSIAGTDDFMALKVNPAAVGFGNSNGISFLGNYDKDGVYEDFYSVFFGADNFGYVLDRVGGNNYHRLLFASGHAKLTNNIYLGTAWDWKNKKFKDGSLSESILFRPADNFSVAAIAYNLFRESSYYELGAALRPLEFGTDIVQRLTFSADTSYRDEEWSKPVLGVQTELIDGIRIGGTYDMEMETFGINFGVALDNLAVGSFARADEDNEFKNGQYYVSFSEKNFRSIFDFKKNSFVKYNFGSEVRDVKKVSAFGPFSFIMSSGKTTSRVIREINKIKNDDDVQGIVLINQNFSSSLAIRQELIDCIKEFKAAGKKVVFYYEAVGGSNYAFAASVADQIYLNPAGMVEFKGIAASLPYVKGLLDTLGIDVINLRSHDYKTAANMFSETEMTEAERESYETLLEGIFTEVEMMIEEGRGDKLTMSLRELIDEKPIWLPEEAVEYGLVDELVFEDELSDKLKELYEAPKIDRKYSYNKYRYDWSDGFSSKVAVIYAVGNIHSGKGRTGNSIGSVSLVKMIKAARKDKSVKGIILRVDSGGGSALASDVIAREIKLCTTGKNKKPFIVSMGGAAASGGYYISMYADKIICQPSTITGSIGVVGMVPIMERLYEKILINWDTVKIGEYSDFQALHRYPTDEEMQFGNDMIHHFYNRFVESVAEGRNMTVRDVNNVAQGRVWTGKQALERGLVDKLGGMDVAIEEMKTMLNTRNELNLVKYAELDGMRGFTVPIDASTILPEEVMTVLELADKLNVTEKDRVQMILPYMPKFK